MERNLILSIVSLFLAVVFFVLANKQLNIFALLAIIFATLVFAFLLFEYEDGEKKFRIRKEIFSGKFYYYPQYNSRCAPFIWRDYMGSGEGFEFFYSIEEARDFIKTRNKWQKDKLGISKGIIKDWENKDEMAEIAKDIEEKLKEYKENNKNLSIIENQLHQKLSIFN